MFGDVYENARERLVARAVEAPLTTRLLDDDDDDVAAADADADAGGDGISRSPSALPLRGAAAKATWRAIGVDVAAEDDDEERGDGERGGDGGEVEEASTTTTTTTTTPTPSRMERGDGSRLFRASPLAPSGRRERVYAFDPWTKVAVVLRPSAAETASLSRPRWCWRPRDPSWWVAWCFLIGSIGFAVGGFASSTRRVAEDPRLYFRLEVMPYMIGGLHFLAGSCLLLYTSWKARYGEPGRADRKRVARKHRFMNARGRGGATRDDDFWTLRAAVGERGVVGVDATTVPLDDEERSELLSTENAMEEARALWLANDSWTRRRRALEVVSAALILAGVVLFKVMIFTMFLRAVSPAEGKRAMRWSERRELWLYFYPSFVGSASYVAGSYVLWCAANRSWRPPWTPSNVSTWIAWLSFIGSLLYLIGSCRCPEWLNPPLKAVAPWASDGAPTLFVGYFVGSLVFAAQSALMIHEIACAAEEAKRRAAESGLRNRGGDRLI